MIENAGTVAALGARIFIETFGATNGAAARPGSSLPGTEDTRMPVATSPATMPNTRGVRTEPLSCAGCISRSGWMPSLREPNLDGDTA
jgi:hypothetical protein